jgi:hypothetical protein
MGTESDRLSGCREASRRGHTRELRGDALYQPKSSSANSSTAKARVKAFAEEIGIAPSIVVGRLQRDEVIPYSHMNDLKIRLTWV